MLQNPSSEYYWFQHVFSPFLTHTVDLPPHVMYILIMLGKILCPPDPMSYLCSLVLRIWISLWRREGSAGMGMWNAPMVLLGQPLTYKLVESMGLGGQRWQWSSWQRGIAERGCSWLSTLMIDIPGDLIWCEICHACSKPATWKGVHWCGCCPCICMLIKNLMMMMMMLGFNDSSTLLGHFVLSPREREKRDSRGNEREGQGRKRNRKKSEETEEEI